MSKKQKYEPIIPRSEYWPVVQLSNNREKFVQEVIDLTYKEIKAANPNYDQLLEELETTLYRERIRIRSNPWKADPDDELAFWKSIKVRMVNLTAETESEKKELDAVLYTILERYANEISGSFKRSSYQMATRLVTFGFNRLLNAARLRTFSSLWSDTYQLRDKIQIHGEVELLRKLALKGTIVMVPTHFSNLDSILIGWVIHELGLPPFIYGAGLNLFNISILAYFMNSLGAYKVDRRKKNYLYLETLRNYSSQAIYKGAHSLFFPGGTRSRSGHIEKKLKLGLLGSAIEAQRLKFTHPDSDGKKIFIVPVTINYHFVLEAPSLINDFLRREGQERFYQEADEYSTSYKIIKFLLKFFTKGSDISVTIGKGMDLLGNYVDEEGNSLDNQQRIIDLREYFMSNGQVNTDEQREKEYASLLGNRIVEEFHKNNRMFASHLVAFTAFELLKKKHNNLDLFSLLRLPDEEIHLDYDEFRDSCLRVRKKIFKLRDQGRIKTASHLEKDIDEVIEHGLANVGLYHAKRPLIRTKSGNIFSQNLNTLYYYRNRSDGYGLEQVV